MIDRVQRINWIDWSKVFAIYLVALGHLLGNTGMEGYLHNCIYFFHMPFFFFVSGYL
ncbi:acyltransferase family protein, partial [Segatella oris]